MTPDIRRELQEIKLTIKRRYPDAVFRLTPSADRAPRTRWLHVYSDLADIEGISDLVTEDEMELLLGNNFHLAVLPHALKYLPKPAETQNHPIRLYSTKKRQVRPSAIRVRERRATYAAKRKPPRPKS